ncbi:toxin-antitoxin system YwqK family antitoxin [Aquimarina sp. 2201CG5-10]|uniref:toxin-antitoxin system YwqK family antitoxin n=1 Tax=Aquimarina callyspongiae TaxID=3098150 RepID=UPI002AB4BC5E|nr:toxin-antitoxin system YwqK family antitoxin [Aquimarina sp. 2201CG5-10]MDY8135592.1 toxin-antitoxin system YwqK family antitoxin [Aquimarina sp. 2201CG5-10]
MKNNTVLLLLSTMLVCISCSDLEIKHIERYKNGNVKGIGMTKGSEKIGIWALYDEQGFAVDSVAYVQGFKEGVSRTYNLMTGEMIAKGVYKQGKKQGIWESYHDGGAVHTKEEFNKGKRIGEMAYFFADGTPKIITAIQNDKFHGEHKEYYPGGQISITGYYHNGVEDATWKEYYEDGLIKEIYNYQAGLWHGTYEKYYPNGNIAEKGRYELDNKKGTWEYFDTNGIVISTKKYR